MSKTIYNQYHINTPNEKWSSLSLGYYADYKPFTTKDGEGFRCSLYVSGCPFNCPGCFNKKAQSFLPLALEYHYYDATQHAEISFWGKLPHAL